MVHYFFLYPLILRAMPVKENQKSLLIFAHPGEAQAFLAGINFQPIVFSVKGLYEAEREFLLLTGGGLRSTGKKLAAVCDAFRKNISQVINLGIAGSLDERCAEGEIYPIRNVFRESRSGEVFEIYRSAGSQAVIDCISAEKAVLNPSHAARLSPLASMVDMELWAIAAVCSQFNLPFRAYKLISDIAGHNTDFRKIKARAGEYSERLYRFYNF